MTGYVVGAFRATCTAPLARLTLPFQVKGIHSDIASLNKPRIWHEACQIIKKEGFRSLWKGNTTMALFRAHYVSWNFFAFEHYKKFLVQKITQPVRRTADFAVNIASGGLAGMMPAIAAYPLDLVRTRLRAQGNTTYYRGIECAFFIICREEGGALGMYKGLGSMLLSVGPTFAISFSVYEFLKSSWKSQRPNDSTVMVSLACGSLSGIASSTVTFLLDVARRRMQLECGGGEAHTYKNGLLGTLRQIIRSDGLRGVYRGMLPEYCKVVLGFGLLFMIYEIVKTLLPSDIGKHSQPVLLVEAT